MTKTQLLDRFAPQGGEQRILLSRVLDQKSQMEKTNMPMTTVFLSPAEQVVAEDMLRAAKAEVCFFGGYAEAERVVAHFSPPWQDETLRFPPLDGPIGAIEATFHRDAQLSHRDILGSLMALGIERELIGDILLNENVCQIVVLERAIAILLSQWQGAGRWNLTAKQIPLSDLSPSSVQVQIRHDTVATPRLDTIVACGFSLSRSKAAQAILAGRVQVNHRLCQKPDKIVVQGDKISCRGMGKCEVANFGGQSRKGRIQVEIKRFV